MRIDLGDEEQPEISLVALIDCIFFLLMFFMVATSFKQQEMHRKQKELPIVLPAADFSLEAGEQPSAPLVLTVARDGTVYVAATPVSAQALHELLRAEAAARPTRRVRIDGDRRAAYQHVVRVVELCQFEGLVNIALRTLDSP
jgi:biopolymer transport protein ExbD